uniref:Uncharacterized protein n=1 Tax=Setaria viridis TaxID=4556 RepID=A0A4U6UEW1_SETVI|nr:hypothetical protein SEVIR_5G177550v2 [Setaria viridis]
MIWVGGSSPARRCPLSPPDVQLELPQVSTSASQAHPPTRTALQGAISGFLSAHLRWRTRRVQRDGLWPPAAKAASMQVAPVDDESCSSSPPSMVHSLRTRNNSAAPPPV